MSNFVEAIADLDTCLESNSADREALLQRGWLYLQMGELDYAAEDIAESLELASSQSIPAPLCFKYAQVMKARADLQAGRLERSKERLER